MIPADWWREAAPAKLNLTLRVTGRRADGYHLLDSLVLFAAIGDALHWQPDDSGTLTVILDGPGAAGLHDAPVTDNLVWRAAHALAERAQRPLSGRLTLTKRLPVSSGIGGGSADAAACLRLLARCWQLTADLSDLALTLGADVPVCLRGQAARMTGIGETVTPLPTPPALPVLLVNPGVAIATPAVFRARAAAGTAFSAPLPPPSAWPQDAAGLAALMQQGGNDLAAAARQLSPIIDMVLAALAACPGSAGAAMSGSGATCFALFQDSTACTDAAQAIKLCHSGWWVMPTVLIG